MLCTPVTYKMEFGSDLLKWFFNMEVSIEMPSSLIYEKKIKVEKYPLNSKFKSKTIYYACLNNSEQDIPNLPQEDP